MVQKQRLQQLESEYALKIQKLKEAQALRNKGVQLDLPPEPSVRTAPSPEREPPAQTPACSPHLPQPSLHDLTLDKLNLESDDVSEADDHEVEAPPPPAAPPPAAAGGGGRRHSLRQSSCSFTKPHLEQQSPAPAKDGGPNKPPKMAASPGSSSEAFAKLDVDALRRRYQQRPPLPEVLHREWSRVVLEVERLPVGEVKHQHAFPVLPVCLKWEKPNNPPSYPPPHSSSAPAAVANGGGYKPVRELHAEASSIQSISQSSPHLQVLQVNSHTVHSHLSLCPPPMAQSVLLWCVCACEVGLAKGGSAVCLRFSPYYRTKEKLSLRSVTYSNTLDPMKSFCRFDLTGTCNDDDCRW